MFLTDWVSEHNLKASYVHFKQNTNNDIDDRLVTCKALLVNSVYPRLSRLSRMLTEPLNVNEYSGQWFDALSIPHQGYVISNYTKVYVAFFRSETQLNCILFTPEEEHILLERYSFDLDKHLTGVSSFEILPKKEGYFFNKGTYYFTQDMCHRDSMTHRFGFSESQTVTKYSEKTIGQLIHIGDTHGRHAEQDH